MINPLTLTIRFSDLDPMGHVNNAVYLSYFEMARVYYFNKLLGNEWDWQKNSFLLARNEIDYIKPLTLIDSPEISLNLVDIGTKSFILNYVIKVKNEVYAEGQSTLVYFDLLLNKSKAIDDNFRNALMKLNNLTK